MATHANQSHSNKKAAAEKAPKVKDLHAFTTDEETIIDESAHIPDRDQIFARADKGLPPDLESLYDDSWSENANDRVSDDRSSGKDFYTALRDLDRAGHLSRPVGPLPSETDGMTKAYRAEFFDKIEQISDSDLKKVADAMAIPGRESMSHHELLEAIRSSTGVH